jgi:epoxyqueuosine reductase
MMVIRHREGTVEDRTQALADWAAARGYRAAWGPLRALDPVRDELCGRTRAGEIDTVFARDNLSFDFGRPSRPPAGWSLVVVAMPRPAHVVSFSLGGERLEAVLPPTYERYRPTFDDVRRDLLAHSVAGSRVVKLKVPLKALAVRLGLARYGRNNLAYVSPFGSYIQLLGYATHAPLPVEANWTLEEPRLLDACARCRACRRSCPTDAIGAHRVLLRAERCLTLANENGGAWPDWVPPTAHHCLLGCLQCQGVCPANPALETQPTGIVFSDEETAALLTDDDRRGPVWKTIRAKLRRLGQPYSEPAIGRNLRALVAARESGRKAPYKAPRRASAQNPDAAGRPTEAAS